MHVQDRVWMVEKEEGLVKTGAEYVQDRCCW